jgi:hypothetical protein
VKLGALGKDAASVRYSLPTGPFELEGDLLVEL